MIIHLFRKKSLEAEVSETACTLRGYMRVGKLNHVFWPSMAPSELGPFWLQTLTHTLCLGAGNTECWPSSSRVL